MRSLVLFALLSVAAAKPTPGDLLGGWDGGLSLGHANIAYAQPAITVAHAAPVIQAAPVVHAPVIAAKAATSYSSFQRVIHPAVAHQVVAQPVVHAAPVIQAAPIAVAHAPVASIGHGWGGW